MSPALSCATSLLTDTSTAAFFAACVCAHPLSHASQEERPITEAQRAAGSQDNAKAHPPSRTLSTNVPVPRAY